MSDPVTNAEIEDVLSSIRRLVSEDSRKSPRALAKPAPGEHGRLVLTPALRVADPVEIAAAEPAPEQVADRSTGQAREQATPWTDPDATLFEAAGRGASEPALDGAAGTEAETAGRSERDRPEGKVIHRQENVAGLSAGDHDSGDPVFAALAADPDDPFREMPDAAALDSGSESEWRNAEWQAEDTEQDGTDQQAEAAFFEAAAAEDEESVFSAGNAEETGEPVESAQQEKPLGPTVAALEAAIGKTADQWEPDGAGGDEYAGTPVETLQWEDHTRAAQTPRTRAPGPMSPDPAADEATGFDATQGDTGEMPDLMAEETILDEESLRGLVTDIVREELQGALGERITRNVRKLVRREIHRALAAQELE